MAQTFKRRITCTCHRAHKNIFFKHKCRLHRHNIYYGTQQINPIKPIKTIKRKRRLPQKNVFFKNIFTTKRKRHKRIRATPYPTIIPNTTPTTKTTPANLKPFTDAIEKIQKCDNMEICGEIKNYITLNVCSVNSPINEILFYYTHLPKSTQHKVFSKVVEFGKTI